MRVLLVGAGAGFSTKDVETGIYDALQAAGVDVRLYLLDRRITLSLRWLSTLWRSGGRKPEYRPGWPDAIYQAGIGALEMALRFQVDWVLAVSAMYFHPDVLEMMRRAGIRTSVVFSESPYDDEKQARVAELVDVCWTNERTSVPYLRQFNPNTFYLRAAYDPSRHSPEGGGPHRALATVANDMTGAGEDVPSHDVVFVGSGFQERIDLLSAVDWTGIDLGLYGMWTLLPPRHKLRKYLKGGITDNDRTAALYRAAKIGLNLHRTSREYAVNASHIDHAESMNPRAYELAACGVFHVSDVRAEINETFCGMLPTFSSPDTLGWLVRSYLEIPGARDARAEQVRELIEPHTFAARAAQILADLESIEQPLAKGA